MSPDVKMRRRARLTRSGRRKPVDWALHDSQIGVLNDRVLARVIGVHEDTVLQRRKFLGIPAVHRKTVWTSVMTETLRRMWTTADDDEIALVLGVSRSAVQKRRHTLGHVHYTHHAVLSEEELWVLAINPRVEAARLLRVHPRVVERLRRHYGLTSGIRTSSSALAGVTYDEMRRRGLSGQQIADHFDVSRAAVYQSVATYYRAVAREAHAATRVSQLLQELP